MDDHDKDDGLPDMDDMSRSNVCGRIMDVCRKMDEKCIWMDEMKVKVKIKDGRG